MDAGDGAGLRFRCLDGCGFCCTTSPGLLEGEEHRLPAALVVRRDDGTLGLRLDATACAALGPERACGVYAERPAACRQFPVHLHVLDRVQATLHRGCPGLGPEGDPADALADAALARLGPSGEAAARKARAQWTEFRRRLASVGLDDEPGTLRDAAVALAPRLWTADGLARLYAAVEDGDVLAAGLVDAFDEASPTTPAAVLLADVAEETFGGVPEAVDADLAWLSVRRAADGLVLVRHARETSALAHGPVAVERLPLFRFEPGAAEALAAGLGRLARRDLALGAAARLVDLLGYRVTLAAAYGRVVADQAAGLTLRSALLAHAAGRRKAAPADARLALAAQETAFLALPTVGAVL